MLVLFTISTLCACGKSYSIQEQIAWSVVIVNSSSGVVIYSDNSKALVLTAYHVIAEEVEKAACSGCEIDLMVKYMYMDYDETPDPSFERYKAINIDSKQAHDLALIEIHPTRKVWSMPVAKKTPKLGESIWLGANPNYNYRSIRPGAISSIDRMVGHNPYIEVSGGIIFGSSGGGAFNKNGELFGTIHAVDAWESPFCYPIFDEEGNVIDSECVSVPLTHIGYVSQTFVLRDFLLKGLYKSYFEYLK